jgi:phage gp29-like protein
MTEKQILNAMKSLDLTREEAIEMLSADEEIDKGAKLFELSDEQKKVAKEMTTAGGGKHKEHKPRERKVDADKKEIMQTLDDALCDLVDNVEEPKNESEISFTYNGASYTIKLIKHRPPKKAE